MSATTEPRRMTQEEYESLPSALALPKSGNEQNIAPDESADGISWDLTSGHFINFGLPVPPQNNVEYFPEMRSLRYALGNVTDTHFPPEGPMTNFSTGVATGLPYLDKHLWETDGNIEALRKLVAYGSDEQQEQAQEILDAIPELIKMRIKVELAAYVKYLNYAREQMALRISGGLWVSALRLTDIRFDQEPVQFHMGLIRRFASVTPTEKSETGYDVPRVEPVIDLHGQTALFPEDAVLYGLAQRKDINETPFTF